VNLAGVWRRSAAVRGIGDDVNRLRTRRQRRLEDGTRRAGRRTVEVERQELIESYVRNHDVRKLQLGAGGTLLPGWLSTDLDPKLPGLVRLDATRRFPFDDETFDVIYAEHMVEHVTWRQGQRMLAECRRVLRPGGVLRLATPDLAALVRLYRGEAGPDGHHYLRWASRRYLSKIDHVHPVFVINNAMRNWGHTFLYDQEVLTLALIDAGFVDIERRAFGESDHEALRGIEAHGSAVSNERAVRFETMVVEARRAAS
jgi:predicted SAM-dependent methyltransferase